MLVSSTVDHIKVKEARCGNAQLKGQERSEMTEKLKGFVGINGERFSRLLGRTQTVVTTYSQREVAGECPTHVPKMGLLLVRWKITVKI